MEHITRYTFFHYIHNIKINYIDILAGVVSCKIQIKKPYYLKIIKQIKNNINYYFETYDKLKSIRYYNIEQIEELFKVGYDEIVLMELFEPIINYNLNNGLTTDIEKFNNVILYNNFNNIDTNSEIEIIIGELLNNESKLELDLFIVKNIDSKNIDFRNIYSKDKVIKNYLLDLCFSSKYILKEQYREKYFSHLNLLLNFPFYKSLMYNYTYLFIYPENYQLVEDKFCFYKYKKYKNKYLKFKK